MTEAPDPEDLEAEILGALEATDSSAQRRRIDSLVERHPARREEIERYADGARKLDRALAAGRRPDPPPTERSLPDPRYRSLEEIGHGAVGVVHRGRDLQLEREIALKILRPELRERAAIARRFLAEARITGRLQHPGIAPVYDLVDAAAQPFIVMKLVEGETLAALLDARGSPRDDLARWLAVVLQICRTVAYAHAQAIVHRDLKPGNVMVGAFGEVVVLDWGFAKLLGAPAGAPDADVGEAATPAAESVPGSVFGTPPYMPPEQARGEVDRIDERSDVFALGAILCETLTGAPAYASTEAQPGPRNADLLEQAREARLDGAYARLANCGADPDLVAIARACLSADRAARPAHAGIVADRLARHLEVVEQRAEAARATALTATLRAAHVSRQRRLFAALAATLLLGMAAFAWAWSAATDAERRATVHLDHYLLLSDVVELRDALAIEATLYPAWPERIPEFEQWLEHRARPLAARRATVRRAQQELEAQIAAAGGATPPSKGQPFLLETLTRLGGDLEQFADPEHGALAAVERRLADARSITARSIDDHRAKWDEARAALAAADGVTASKLYAATPIDLVPQVGMVPLGRNPATGLWEFQDLASHAPGAPLSVLAPDGHVAVAPETGIVFVLVPGGTFRMGAQKLDRDQPGFDPAADDAESPAHEVVVAPFFIGRHEVTQAQWDRLNGAAQAYAYPAGAATFDGTIITAAHPAELVSHSEALSTLRRHGLDLPTEAQWEYACRAGTTTPYWTGATAASLLANGCAANIADRSAIRAATPWATRATLPDYDDGAEIHLPVDSLRPNAFGLHHVLGNVWEWCREIDLSYAPDNVATISVQHAVDAKAMSVTRGGSFNDGSEFTRASYRAYTPSEFRDHATGLRAIRELRPAPR